MSIPAVPSTDSPLPANDALSTGQKLFFGFLAVVAAGLGVWLAWRSVHTRLPELPTMLQPTQPDVAGQAKQYVRERKTEPLKGPLEAILAHPHDYFVKSKAHLYLGKPVPRFELMDHLGRLQKLDDFLQKGPVVLVFYYGYHCDHCVSQLFDLSEDIAYFHQLGAEVIAVSADEPELTRERYAKHGPIAFPVLSDPKNQVAEKYGTYIAPRQNLAEFLFHGTFIIDRQGKMIWADYGDEPFMGNKTLLYELARIEGKLPPGLELKEPATTAPPPAGTAPTLSESKPPQ